MLSRVADALFWMSRYLERAEHVARLLDVCFHSEIDLHGVLSGPHELQWTALATILQLPPRLPRGDGQPHATRGRSLACFPGDHDSLRQLDASPLPLRGAP